MIKKRKRWAVAGLVVLLLVFLFAIAVNDEMVVRYYRIPTGKVGQPVRIALITDLHSCYYGENQRFLIEAVQQEQPDLVLFGGDIADDVIPHDNTRAVIEVLGAQYPCYYVSGNHEYWSREIEDIKQMFRDNGIMVMEGDTDRVTIGDTTVNISGIDDPDGGKTAFFNQLDEVGSKLDEETFTVLLSHRPEQIDAYLEYRFDLILSGHAHGGQWRIPGLLNGLLAPDQGFFPRYAGGLYPFEEQVMIVSRGLAKESTRVPRFFNHRELVIVDIVPDSAE